MAKTKYELGEEAAKLAFILFLEDKNETKSIKFDRIKSYLTGNQVGGVMPMPMVYATTEKNAKSNEAKEALRVLVMDIAEAGLTKTSFYPCASSSADHKGYPWIGEDFGLGFLEGFSRCMAEA